MGLLSGRSAAHPTDRFIRNVAVVVVVVLFGLLLWDQTNRASKPKGELQVSCWVPAGFSESMAKYSDHKCKETEQKYMPTDLRSTDGIVYMNVTNPFLLGGDLHPNQWQTLVATSSLQIYLVAQFVIIILAFMLLRNIACRAITQARVLQGATAGTDNQRQAAQRLSKAYWTSISYIVVQLAYLLAMLVMVGKLRKLENAMVNFDDRKKETHVFMCSFAVRGPGPRQERRFEVQCVGTAPESVESSSIMSIVLFVDTLFCGLVALMIFLHLLQTTLLSQASTDIMATCDLDSANSVTDRIKFGFSDMNLAAMFLAINGGAQLMTRETGHHGESTKPSPETKQMTDVV